MKNKTGLESANIEAWDAHYARDRAMQSYPDENLVRIVKNAPRGAALDFGCGSGRHLKLLHELRYSPVFGTDTSQKAVDHCREAHPYAGVFLSRHPSSGEFFLPFPDEYFDLVAAWGVLHYNAASSLEVILDELRRIMKNGALFTGTLRSTNDTHFAASPDMSGAEVLYFTREECQDLLRGFEDVRIGYLERNPPGEDRRVCHWIFSARNAC